MTKNEERSLKLPDEYLTEIGRVCYQWSILEFTFNLWLIKLVDLDFNSPRSQAVFAHMTFPVKLDLFAALVNDLKSDFPMLSDYKKILEMLRKSQKDRNEVIHALWGMSDAGTHATMMRLTARGAIKSTSNDITLDDLKKIAPAINQTILELHRFVVIGSGATPAI